MEYLLVLLMVVCLYLLRNERVYKIRSAFIDFNDGLASYQKLPSYEAMFFNFRHWGRWTVAQWKDWVAR